MSTTQTTIQVQVGEETVKMDRLTFNLKKKEELERLIDILATSKDKTIYANFVSHHGSLFGGAPISTGMEGGNVRLFVIATREYYHITAGPGRGLVEHLSFCYKYLRELREGVEEEKSGNIFFDDDGCLSQLGEKTLANMLLTMLTPGDKNYRDWYGNEFPKTPRSWIWNPKIGGAWSSKKVVLRPDDPIYTPFYTLKIYDKEYNDQRFGIDRVMRERFGILFQYRDQDGNIQSFILDLRYLIDSREDHGFIKLSDVFKELEPLFTHERTQDLEFNFTHMSCRSGSGARDELARKFSNKNEGNSKKCFIKKFKYLTKEEKESLELILEEYATIYDFYRDLQRRNMFEDFLSFLNKRDVFNSQFIEAVDNLRGAENELLLYMMGYYIYNQQKKARPDDPIFTTPILDLMKRGDLFPPHRLPAPLGMPAPPNNLREIVDKYRRGETLNNNELLKLRVEVERDLTSDPELDDAIKAWYKSCEVRKCQPLMNAAEQLRKNRRFENGKTKQDKDPERPVLSVPSQSIMDKLRDGIRLTFEEHYILAQDLAELADIPIVNLIPIEDAGVEADELSHSSSSSSSSSSSLPSYIPKTYKCVRRAIIREGFNMDSKKIGVLEKGTVVKALKERVNDEGVTRVAFVTFDFSLRHSDAYGSLVWTSKVTKDGAVVLEEQEPERAATTSNLRMEGGKRKKRTKKRKKKRTKKKTKRRKKKA